MSNASDIEVRKAMIKDVQGINAVADNLRDEVATQWGVPYRSVEASLLPSAHVFNIVYTDESEYYTYVQFMSETRGVDGIDIHEQNGQHVLEFMQRNIQHRISQLEAAMEIMVDSTFSAAKRCDVICTWRRLQAECERVLRPYIR